MGASRRNRTTPTHGLASPGTLASALTVLPGPEYILKAVRGPDCTGTELQLVFLNEVSGQLLGRPVEPLIGRAEHSVPPYLSSASSSATSVLKSGETSPDYGGPPRRPKAGFTSRKGTS